MSGVAREISAIRDVGFVVIPDLIPPRDLAEMRRALEHPLVLTLCDAFLEPNYGLHPRRMLEESDG